MFIVSKDCIDRLFSSDDRNLIWVGYGMSMCPLLYSLYGVLLVQDELVQEEEVKWQQC